MTSRSVSRQVGAAPELAAGDAEAAATGDPEAAADGAEAEATGAPDPDGTGEPAGPLVADSTPLSATRTTPSRTAPVTMIQSGRRFIEGRPR